MIFPFKNFYLPHRYNIMNAKSEQNHDGNSEEGPTRAIDLPEVPVSLDEEELEDNDLDQLLYQLIEEYARLGWDRDQLLSILQNSDFTIPDKYIEEHEEEDVQTRIEEVLHKHRSKTT